MRRGCVVACLVVAACGKPIQSPGDAATDVGDSRADAGSDAPTDAPNGPLSPDPADPASLPCNGMLGFPGPPAIVPVQLWEHVVADVDVDGNEDIVYIESQRIAWVRGHGDGTFADPVRIDVPLDTRALRVVDLDGDGDRDLVFRVRTAAFVNEIWVVHYDGNGGFGSPETLYSATNFGVGQLEVADVNADGKLDLLTLASTADSVGVLLNTGSSFAAPQLYKTATIDTWQMAVGDVSGDGHPDIVATISGPAVSVLVNNGDGTFANRATYPSPQSPWGIVLADVNEDGHLDVVIGTSAQSLTADISVMLNQGGGILGSATTYPVGTPLPAPRTLRAADLDGDGHIDIGVAETNDDYVRLLLGTGTGQFGAPLVIPKGRARGLQLEDINEDGRIDMVALGASITPYLNTGTPAIFEARTVHALELEGFRRWLYALDLDENGRLDLTGVADDSLLSSSAVVTRLQTSSGAFAPTTTSPSSVRANSAMAADLDNNSRLDFVLLGGNNNSLAVQTLINNGDGSFSAATARNVPHPSNHLTIADLDGDGLRDVIAGGLRLPDPNELRIYRGHGNGQFGPGTPLWAGSKLSGFTTLDLNEDGMRDVVVESAQGMELLLATGNGAFAPPVATQVGLPPHPLLVRDLNADGKQDMIGFSSLDVFVALGTGTGDLSAPTQGPAPSHSGSLERDAAFADFNGDGHLDVVTTSFGSVGILLGNGDGTFRAPLSYESGGPPERVAVGDIDGDGRVDIIVDNGPARVSILHGRCL